MLSAAVVLDVTGGDAGSAALSSSCHSVVSRRPRLVVVRGNSGQTKKEFRLTVCFAFTFDTRWRNPLCFKVCVCMCTHCAHCAHCVHTDYRLIAVLIAGQTADKPKNQNSCSCYLCVCVSERECVSCLSVCVRVCCGCCVCACACSTTGERAIDFWGSHSGNKAVEKCTN